MTVTNSTFSGNSTNINGGLGGGILTNGSSATVTNTLLAGNTASSGHGPDAFGTFISGGGNLIGIVDATTSGFTQPTDQTGTPASPLNPLLGTLGTYGSTNGTQTFPLLPGSPAINAATSTGAPATDQRGQSRVGAPDIGAFESQGFTLTITGGDNQSAIVGTAFAQPLALTVAAVNPVEPVQGGMVTFTPPASGPSAALAGSPAHDRRGRAGERDGDGERRQRGVHRRGERNPNGRGRHDLPPHQYRAPGQHRGDAHSGDAEGGADAAVQRDRDVRGREHGGPHESGSVDERRADRG